MLFITAPSNSVSTTAQARSHWWHENRGAYHGKQLAHSFLPTTHSLLFTHLSLLPLLTWRKCPFAGSSQSVLLGPPSLLPSPGSLCCHPSSPFCRVLLSACKRHPEPLGWDSHWPVPPSTHCLLLTSLHTCFPTPPPHSALPPALSKRPAVFTWPSPRGLPPLSLVPSGIQVLPSQTVLVSSQGTLFPCLPSFAPFQASPVLCWASLCSRPVQCPPRLGPSSLTAPQLEDFTQTTWLSGPPTSPSFHLRPLHWVPASFLLWPLSTPSCMLDDIIKPNFGFPTCWQAPPLVFHHHHSVGQAVTFGVYHGSSLFLTKCLLVSSANCLLSPVVFISRPCLKFVCLFFHFHHQHPSPSRCCLSPGLLGSLLVNVPASALTRPYSAPSLRDHHDWVKPGPVSHLPSVLPTPQSEGVGSSLRLAEPCGSGPPPSLLPCTGASCSLGPLVWALFCSSDTHQVLSHFSTFVRKLNILLTFE